MNFYEVPLTADPQTFGITLGGTEYRLTLLYRNCDGGGWVLDVADAAGNPMVGGIPLVTGVDLLGQFKYLGFSGSLFVQGSANPDDVPTFDDLGVGSHLFWVTA